MGLADTMKGMSWSFTCIACISPKMAKEGRPSTWPGGGRGAGRHLIGRQAQDVLCQSQVYSKVLSAIFRPSCPSFCVLRPPQPSLSPLRTAPGRHLKMSSWAFLS